MSGGAPHKPVRIAAVGDLHVHEKPKGMFRGYFEELSQKADVLVLCGDLTTTGLPAEAENLAADLNASTIPVLGVLGNHDHESGHADQVREILRSANLVWLDEEPFVAGHVGFTGVKGFGGGFGRHMLTSFGEDANKKFVAESLAESLKLEKTLQALSTEKTVVALHYSPIPQTLYGESPEIFPFLGSSRLAETIDLFDVSVVFHGHAHHGTFQGRTNRGIPVYNTCLELVRARDPRQPYALVEI